LTVDRPGKHRQGGELAHDHAHGDRYQSTSDDSAQPARRPARNRAGDRGHQQAEHQGEWHYGQHRPARCLRYGQRRRQPSQCGIEDHDHTGDRVRGPLVTFVEFAALSAAGPGEQGLDLRAAGRRFGHFVGTHRIKNTSRFCQPDRRRPGIPNQRVDVWRG
jgi:hypothetical protein